MKLAPFSPAELAIHEAAWSDHKAGNCPDDCGYCSDLIFSGSPSCVAEIARIRAIKEVRRQGKKPKQKALTPALSPPKKVGKGKTAPLKGRVRR